MVSISLSVNCQATDGKIIKIKLAHSIDPVIHLRIQYPSIIWPPLFLGINNIKLD